jgi:hypothetical protein
MEPALHITDFEQVSSCICLSYKRFSFDGFQVLTAVIMKSAILFWDVTQHSMVKFIDVSVEPAALLAKQVMSKS